jgi:hypothetical protein
MDEEQNSKLLMQSNELRLQEKKKRQTYLYTLLAIGIFFTAALIATQLLFSITQTPKYKANSEIKSKLRYSVIAECGSTRQEAIDRGCIFDVMAVEWVPKECYDKEYASDSVAEGTMLAGVGASGVFPWFKDQNRTVSIAQEDLKSLDELVGYTDETFHVAHCLYSWRALAKATRRALWGERDVFLSGAILGEDHINHCNMVIGDQNHRVGAKSKVSFGLGQCIRIEL